MGFGGVCAFDVLALPFASTALGLRELAALECSASSFPDALAPAWVNAIRTVAARRRLDLPVEVLGQLERAELKRAAALLRGPLAGPLDGCARLASKAQLMTVLRLVESEVAARSTEAAYAHARTVIGRLRFEAEDLEEALDIPEADEELEQLYTFSDEINFWWPSPACGRARGITLSAVVGCYRDVFVVDVYEAGKEGRADSDPDISLSFTLRLIHPRVSDVVVLSGDTVSDAGLYGAKWEGLDIADRRVREILSGPEGMLCVLSVAEMPKAATRSGCKPVARVKSGEAVDSAHLMNALGLIASDASRAARRA